MRLPLSDHRYGEHGVVLPPAAQDRHDAADIDLDTRLAMYRKLQEMRQFEKRAYDLFMRQLVKGTSHLSLGMEAIAAGFGAAMRRRRLHLRDVPRSRPHAGPGRGDDAGARRAARPGQRADGRQGRLDAPDQRRARDDGLVRDHRRPPDHRERRRVVGAVPRIRARSPCASSVTARRTSARSTRRSTTPPSSSSRSCSSARTTCTWSTRRSRTSPRWRVPAPTGHRRTGSSRSSSTATTPTRCT